MVRTLDFVTFAPPLTAASRIELDEAGRALAYRETTSTVEGDGDWRRKGRRDDVAQWGGRVRTQVKRVRGQGEERGWGRN